MLYQPTWLGNKRKDLQRKVAGSALMNKKKIQKCDNKRNLQTLPSPCPQSGFSCWDGWVPPSFSSTAHWSYILWWSKKTNTNMVITVMSHYWYSSNWLLQMIITTFFSSLKALVAVSSSREPGVVLFKIFWKVKMVLKMFQGVNNTFVWWCRGGKRRVILYAVPYDWVSTGILQWMFKRVPPLAF